MFNKKKIAIISLTLVMIIGLTACSPKSNNSGGKNANANASGLRPEGVPADFPNKEIKYIYGFGPGSVQDAYIRILFDKVKEMEGWEHGVVITYKEGASGKIGWNEIANAKPDGYTIGFLPTAMLIPGIAEEGKVKFGYDKFDYIFNMMSDPGAIGIAADSEYNTLEEFVEAAKANPGKITVGVTSTVGQEGLTMQLLEKVSGASFNVVAFDSESEVLTGVVGGHIDASCLNISDTTTFIENGQIKVLATGAEERSEFLPDVPTYKESGYDVTQVNMRAVGGPKGMPEPIREYLEKCLLAAAEDPEVKEKIKDMQIPLDSLSGGEVEEKFGNINNDLSELWETSPWQ